jgi:hypothetical protein
MIIGAVVILIYSRVANRQADRKIRVIENLPGFRYTY